MRTAPIPNKAPHGLLRQRPVTVIGAGIAGLTVAIALARRGAEVTLHERAAAIAEVGAGIQLSPNAMRVFAALGVDNAIRRVSLRNHTVRLCDTDGRPVMRLDLLRHRPDGHFQLIHRARLIEVLADAARAAGVVLRLGDEVTTMPDAPLVIGADGLHSRVRQALNGREVPWFTGQTAWRALIPDDDQTPEAQIFTGPNRHLVSYPLGRGLRNLVAVLERGDWQDESWSMPDDPANLRAAFAAFGGPVPEWLSRLDQVHVWGLFRHDIARNWHDGRQVIIGDAVHPTLPFMAQGAVMAIEDAWTLAACLGDTPDQTVALARYEALRRDRVARIVAAANRNARNYHLTGARRLLAHGVLRVADRIAPRIVAGRFDWIHDHDPVAAARIDVPPHTG